MAIMKSKYFILAMMFGATMVSCDDILEPAIENNQDVTAIYKNPGMAQGLLGNAYVLLPTPSSPETDLATDDAVTNELDNAYSKLATGAWASDNNQTSRWKNCYHAIQYCNLLIENCDQVQWAVTEPLRTMFNDHFKGDALAMRALFHFYLLEVHAGYVNGQLMGIPYHLSSEDATSDFNQPRLTFVETMQKINEDFDAALALLPDHFTNVNEGGVPDKYKALNATAGEYNRAFGEHHAGKIDGMMIKTIRAKMQFLAASPAYEASGVTNATAAKSLADVLKATVGGISGIDPTGHTWFANFDEIDKLANIDNPKEIMWRAGMAKNRTLDENNFPPTLFGKGRVNPTQNLVDAFYTANGYPITDPASGYDPAKPYENRDPRFYDAIVYNGSAQGIGDVIIDTKSNSATRDGLNKESGYSTRTGYYMRKLTNPKVNCDPSGATDANRYTPRIRYTELFLSYAEAANEAYGPTSDGGNGFSAYDVVKAIRDRAFKFTANGNTDSYLESIKSDKDKMRELIRNERRLEFCFENKRFWDLRRWKVDLTKLNEPAKGMKITDENGVLKYEVIEVEKRNYKDYQYYGPIPYGEIRKFSALEQNQGW